MVNTFALQPGVNLRSNTIFDNTSLSLGVYLSIFVLIRFADASPERASGSEMDEQRKQQMAYQYLCHLEEAKVYVHKLRKLKFLQLRLCTLHLSDISVRVVFMRGTPISMLYIYICN